MHRLFVALRPPAPLRQALLAIMGGVPNARWQSDEQLHLTLKFIGEVDRHQAEDIAAALGSVHHPTLSIALDGLGFFDRRGRVEALWAGVTPHAPLLSLEKKINQALIRAGVAPETRTFLPHITIARFGKSAGPIEAMLADHGGLTSNAEPVYAFDLYESTLGREGSIYTLIARYSLDPA